MQIQLVVASLGFYDKEGGEPRAQKPVDTAVEKYLYTLRKETGEADDSLERWFAGLEEETIKDRFRWIRPRS